MTDEPCMVCNPSDAHRDPLCEKHPDIGLDMHGIHRIVTREEWNSNVPLANAINELFQGARRETTETDGGAEDAGGTSADEPAPSSPDRCVLCDAARAVPSVFCLRHGGTS